MHIIQLVFVCFVLGRVYASIDGESALQGLKHFIHQALHHSNHSDSSRKLLMENDAGNMFSQLDLSMLGSLQDVLPSLLDKNPTAALLQAMRDVGNLDPSSLFDAKLPWNNDLLQSLVSDTAVQELSAAARQLEQELCSDFFISGGQKVGPECTGPQSILQVDGGLCQVVDESLVCSPPTIFIYHVPAFCVSKRHVAVNVCSKYCRFRKEFGDKQVTVLKDVGVLVNETKSKSDSTVFVPKSTDHVHDDN